MDREVMFSMWLLVVGLVIPLWLVFTPYIERSKTFKKTVVFDFDGVIHSYISGWQGVDVINDPPVKGIEYVIEELRLSGYNVVVVSTRCSCLKGRRAIRKWLNTYNIEVDKVCAVKPPALVYIDDRAICFDGCADGALVEQIKTFKNYIKRGK